MCDRIPQFFEDRRIHRGPVWFHRDAEITSGPHRVMDANCRFTPFGIGVGARNQIALVIRCSAERKRFIPRKVGPDCRAYQSLPG